ncbi:MAG TPA: hypothetical protein ENJ35_01080 [Gammaproteobacteria bacterium]|nr:hypothetical protein [Gammaproteobacteria bacterium]
MPGFNSRHFVDASIPQDQLTRLDMMKTESRAWAEQLEEHLLKGGCFPEWSDTELQAHIPNEAHRQQTISEMNPRSLAFFTEPIPLPKEWFAVPAGYIQFTDAYAVPASQAEDQGWPITRLPAGHFHMLVDPVAVSDALINMLGQLVH